MKELAQEQKDAEEEAAKAKTTKQPALFGFFQSSAMGADEEGSVEFSFAGLFKIMFCTHQKAVDEKQQLVRIATTLETLNKRLDSIERYERRHPSMAIEDVIILMIV